MLLFLGDVEYAKNHGVVKLGDEVVKAGDNTCLLAHNFLIIVIPFFSRIKQVGM